MHSEHQNVIPKPLTKPLTTNQERINTADAYAEAMKKKGFSYETTESLRKFKCPYCGFEFSLLYARTFACQGCSEALRSCPKVRCQKCDTEFFINETPRINTKEQQKFMADHICEVVEDYRNRHGFVGNR